MATIIDYVENQNKRLKGRNFCVSDAITLTLLSYLHFDIFTDRRPLKTMAAYNQTIVAETRVPELNIQLLQACQNNNRFNNIKIFRYINREDVFEKEQFAAITFFIDWRTVYVAFRGTDGTINGWHEDFNLAFMEEIPAQNQALSYLKSIVKKYWWCRIIIGGHSKGGNIATYAYMKLSAKEKKVITRVYNFDGPGFNEKTSTSLFNENSGGNVIEKYIPEESIIGLLLFDPTPYKTVSSNGRWFSQHDIYNWKIDALSGSITNINQPSERALNLSKLIYDWLGKYDIEEREIIIKGLFDIIYSSSATEIDDVIDNWKKLIPSFLRQYFKADKKTRSLLRKSLFGLPKKIKKITSGD